LLAEELGLGDDGWRMAFQSRFGRGAWLTPSTEDVLEEWRHDGLERLDVICPGFATDCLETLEEIALSGRRLFAAAGGGELRYIPALNDRQDHVEALSELLLENLQGWV
jgi:ferrochelatase